MAENISVAVFEGACNKSLENAKQLLADAKLLMHDQSYGHAIALAVFSDEELAKAYICWLVAKGLIPKESKAVNYAFKSHREKHLTQIGVQGGLILREELEQGKISLVDVLRYGIGLTERQIERDQGRLQQIAEERESMRKYALYVNLRDGEVYSPFDYTREQAADVISGINLRLNHQERLMTSPKPEELASLKSWFDSIPREYVMEGEVPIDWFASWGKKNPVRGR